MGRSCIVGNVAGCKAIIVDNFNGCVIQKYSADEIADKIQYLQENRYQIRIWIRSAGDDSWDSVMKIVIDKTLRVYSKLLVPSTTKRYK